MHINHFSFPRVKTQALQWGYSEMPQVVVLSLKQGSDPEEEASASPTHYWATHSAFPHLPNFPSPKVALLPVGVPYTCAVAREPV